MKWLKSATRIPASASGAPCGLGFAGDNAGRCGFGDMTFSLCRTSGVPALLRMVNQNPGGCRLLTEPAPDACLFLPGTQADKTAAP